ncbi:MAG: hypothetical protein HFI81_01890 [Eubacterium sp.]|jgi:hypothetical protein|nr:hypothetical protein [Eubacterium sp.]
MEDLIDKRNFRERCARSIVKGYNVRYVYQEDTQKPAEQPDAAKEEERPWKDDILESEKKWANIPSSEYGKRRDNDPVTEEQIKKILGERKDVMDTIKDFG